MKEVIDSSGNKIPGLFKNSDGSITVKKPDEYLKAVTFKTRIDSMESRIDELNTLVNKLISNMKNNDV